MRTQTNPKTKKKRAFALVIVMVFAAISLTALTGALSWTSSSAQQTARTTQYFETAAAAEAASEKVLATLREDYQNGSTPRVLERMNAYASMTPTAEENAVWNKFAFTDGAGNAGTAISKIKEEEYVELDSQYAGLKGWAATYRITSRAQQKEGSNPIAAGVVQEVQTASIPIFQFAIFYGLDLELHSLTEMNIHGRVHCNQNIYTYPSDTTTFFQDVTSAGSFYKTRKPGDPAYSKSPPDGDVVFKKKKDAKVASLQLPIGTNNTPAAVREVLLPPAGEPATAAISRERFYNKAELVILVDNSKVTAFVQTPFKNKSYPISWPELSLFVKTNVSFTDQREKKVMKVTEIDVGKIQAWSLANLNVSLAVGIGKPVNLIYVNDRRTVSSSQMTAVRLVNGQILPSRGLTVATPNPLYVKGHYNQEYSGHLGTANTSKTKPAALIADAITALSSEWKDSESADSYKYRDAANMTVNAAVLTGIVETSTSSSIYSGGAHNLLRFLEDWDGRTLTYNGSMVVLFNSIRATRPFEQPGEYYYPPERDFSFDQNFLQSGKLPPGTPELRGIIRDQWAHLNSGQEHL